MPISINNSTKSYLTDSLRCSYAVYGTMYYEHITLQLLIVVLLRLLTGVLLVPRLRLAYLSY